MLDAYHLNDRVLLLVHTPFGINEGWLYRFYEIQYEQKLLSIINKFSSIIIMCLTAHRHYDLFRVYSSAHVTMGMLGHPSLSPLSYLAHPSIRKYSYDRKSIILTDFEQYALHINEVDRTNKDVWTLSYRFSSWYHQSKELTSNTLHQLVYLIRSNSFYLKRFLLAKYQAEDIIITKHQIVQTLCALTLFNFDEFILCVRLLENKNMQYDNISFNNSREINVHMNEQLIEYRIIYKRVALSLFIFIVITFWIIYQIYLKFFYKDDNEK
jgi:hypothetical protein